MLQCYGFERIAVVFGDLYFLDPEPSPGQEGAERGVRVELRLLERGELPGSIYSAQPITLGRAVWRVDLLETVSGRPGSFDRTHHHPAFAGPEPCGRRFVPELSARPVEWVADRLGDLGALLAEAGVDPGEVPAADLAEVERAVPEIVEALRRLLARVYEGELAVAPDSAAGGTGAARTGWL